MCARSRSWRRGFADSTVEKERRKSEEAAAELAWRGEDSYRSMLPAEAEVLEVREQGQNEFGWR